MPSTRRPSSVMTSSRRDPARFQATVVVVNASASVMLMELLSGMFRAALLTPQYLMKAMLLPTRAVAVCMALTPVDPLFEAADEVVQKLV
ncbi:MAG: hypothetical protein AB8I80_05260, partial [Anaerolineae bacterium]